MATSSRPKRKIHRRSLDYHEGLLHEEELAIRRALQASLLSTKPSTDNITDKKQESSSSSHGNITNTKKEPVHNNNHVLEHKEKKAKKKRLTEKQESDDSASEKSVITRTPKKQRLEEGESVTSRSRSSSLNSSSTNDSFNSSSSSPKHLTKTVNSAGCQTKVKSNKIHNVKSPKKEKLAVKIRKTLLKRKLKEARLGSDGEGAVSNSPVENVTSKKTRKSRKRKGNTPFIQKKFASVTPTKTNLPTPEMDTSKPLAKAEDFLDFLCLRGHPLMPNYLDIFNNPYQSPIYEEDFPSSPPSSLLSELPSSPSPSIQAQDSVDSPSWDTPTSDVLTSFEEGLHAMRMYAGIENRSKEVVEESKPAEITIEDLEHEEEPQKNSLSITPPLSFRVSPRPTPPLSKERTSTHGLKISPSPAPRMTMPPSTSELDTCTTPETPSFGPPPLMLSQRRTSGSGGCCSPPPLLYIPAAAQRVTHLHGPPKLERVRTTASDSVLKDSPPILTRHSQRNVEFNDVQGKDKTETLNNRSENRDSKLIHEAHLESARPSTAIGSSKETFNLAKSLSTENLATNCRNSNCYTRNTQSCPLHYASDIRRIEQARKDLNDDPKIMSVVPVARPSSQGANTGILPTHVGYINRDHGVCSVPSLKQSEIGSSPQSRSSSLDLSCSGSPDSAVSLAGTSLLENLQKAHDRCGFLSPSGSNADIPSFAGNKKLSPSPKKLHSFTDSTRRPPPEYTSRTMKPSDSSDERSNLYSTLIKDHSTYSPPSSGPDSLQARQTSLAFPSKGSLPESLTPPWSHIQALYSPATTPPRPYTLSVDSHTSHLNRHGHAQQRIVPRTIPLVPSNQVPLIPLNKHVSVPFNGGFLHSQHHLPSAFEGASSKIEKPVGDGNGRLVDRGKLTPPGVRCSALSETHPTSGPKSSLLNTNASHLEVARGSTRSHGETTPQDSNIVTNSRTLSVGMDDKSHHPDAPIGGQNESCDISQPIAADEGSPEKSKVDSVLNSTTQYKTGCHSDAKKRRGRPLGSKNKKTSIEEDTNKDCSGNTTSKQDSHDVKEKNGSESKSPSKKKKVECPILRPTEEEFKDPLGYLRSVRSTLEKFGICIIDPPESWKLESHLPGNPRFTTKRQLIHRLQKRWGPTEIKLACIESHLQQQQSTFNVLHMPVVGGCDLDLAEVSRIVMEHGGMQKVIDNKKWNKVADLLRIPKSTQDRIGKVQDAYCKYLLSFDLLPESEKENLEREVQQEIDDKGNADEYRDDCYLKGRSFSMACFQRTARNFQEHFFKTDPSVNEVEREFWKIVQSRDKYVAAHHVKLDSKQHGTCFPTAKTDPYTKNGWNLNVLANLKGTILRHAGNVEDLTIPWLNIDMLFSTKRWTTTPLDTYLIDFLHSSNDKVWYGIPESDIEKFPHSRENNTNDYEDGEFMVSPSNLSRETGLNMTRLEQKQGQFVVVAPKVFHCSISSGYSVSETVSFGFSDWILRTSTLDKDIFLNWPGFSYEKVLLKSIDEISNAGKECLECLLSELQKIRDKEVSMRKELQEVGVGDCTTTSTTAKAVQTITTENGPVQVNGSAMYCVMCQRLCHLSAVLREEESELLCLSNALSYVRKDNSSEQLSIVTNFSVSQLEESILSVTKKLEQL